MSGHSEAMSEQSPVLEGMGYNEVFLSGHGPKEGLSQSSEREPFARSLVDEEEDFDGDEVERNEANEDNEGEGENEGELEVGDDENEDESNGGASVEGSSRSPGDGHTCPFILPKIWTINDIKPMMTTNIFKNLWDYY